MSNTETKYLDLSGLSRYLQKTKEYINDNCIIKDENIDISDGHLKIGTLLTIGANHKVEMGANPTLGSYTHIETTHISEKEIKIGSMRVPVGSYGNYTYLNYTGLSLGSTGLTINSPVKPYSGSGTYTVEQYYFKSNGDLKSNTLNCGSINCETIDYKTGSCETLKCQTSTFNDLTVRNLMKSNTAVIGSVSIGNDIDIYKDGGEYLINVGSGLVLSNITGEHARMYLKGTDSSQRYVCNIDEQEIIFTHADAFWGPIWDAGNSFSIDGLKYPLSIKYRDASNTEKEFEYRGGVPSESNNQNILDLRDLSAPSIEGITHVTYNELKVLRDNGELSPGTKYRITDYETIISGYNTAGHNFDIVVEALDNHILSENADVCPSLRDTIINLNDYKGEVFQVSHQRDDWSGSSMLDSNDIPRGIWELQEGGYAHVHCLEDTFECDPGHLRATLNYAGGALKFYIVGMELVSRDYISSDYHKGSSGNAHNNNTYELFAPKKGTYTIRYYIERDSESQYNRTDFSDSTVRIERYGSQPEYFTNCNMNAWEIKYCLDNDTNRFGWANTTSGKGVIYYMKDENNNEAYYDFKNVKYGDHYTFDYLVNGTHYDGSTKYGKYCHHNIITRDVDGNKYTGLPKIYFKNTSATAECYYNIFDNDVWNMTFGSGCYKNSFGSGSEGNSFGDNCKFNIVKSNCKNNSLGHNCESNVFGNECKNNKLISNCTNNIFGNNCEGNEMANNCHSNSLQSYCNFNKFSPGSNFNTFNDYCKNNILGCNDNWEYDSSVGGCISNTFGYSCVGNLLKEKCLYNTFGDRFGIKEALSQSTPAEELGNKLGANSISNKFGVSCYSNEFGNNCSYNNIGDYCYLNTFGNYCQSNTMGTYCYSNTMGSYVLRCEIGKKVANCLISDGLDSPAIGAQCITIKSNCNNVKIWSNDDPTLNSAGVPTSNICYVEVGPGISGSFEISRNLEYITSIEKNSRGEIRCFCKAD